MMTFLTSREEQDKDMCYKWWHKEIRDGLGTFWCTITVPGVVWKAELKKEEIKHNCVMNDDRNCEERKRLAEDKMEYNH